MDCQASPTAMTQLVPSGDVMMMVQVSPLPLERTSTSLPLLVTPTAIGASLYLLDSWVMTFSRGLHRDCACTLLDTKAKAVASNAAVLIAVFMT